MDRDPAAALPLTELAALREAVGSLNRSPGPRVVPGRSIPVPLSVSDSSQRTIALPYRDAEWKLEPADAADWRKAVANLAATTASVVAQIADRLGVQVAESTIAGVPVFEVTPSPVAPQHANRLMVNTHGGGYVFNPGRAGLLEAVVIAARCGIKVVAVDYRMPPDHPYPAALDDAFAVWKAVVNSRPPGSVGLSGGSAGGGLALATTLRAKRERVPLPAALAIQTPWADLEEVGDSLQTNEWLDNVLVSYRGVPERAARLYANGHDLGDPFLSPLRGDFSGFPPTMLLSGTRDLFLSLTVLVHRKLRRAGVPAELHVVEGASHFHYFLNPFAAESEDVFTEMALFLDRYLVG
jgi:acetyl esterase/lipase